MACRFCSRRRRMPGRPAAVHAPTGCAATGESQAIVPLNSDPRVERTGDGAPAVQEGLHKARDKFRGLVRQPGNVFVMRIPVAAFAA